MEPQVADELLFRVVDALDEVAAETGKTIPQIALNWLLQSPSVATVSVGTWDENQLRDNPGALGWSLAPEQVARLSLARAMLKRCTPRVLVHPRIFRLWFRPPPVAANGRPAIVPVRSP